MGAKQAVNFPLSQRLRTATLDATASHSPFLCHASKDKQLGHECQALTSSIQLTGTPSLSKRATFATSPSLAAAIRLVPAPCIHEQSNNQPILSLSGYQVIHTRMPAGSRVLAQGKLLILQAAAFTVASLRGLGGLSDLHDDDGGWNSSHCP